MRIHLPLHPHHFAPQPDSSAPLARIGGELVVIELQGELEWEGDKNNGVIGVLGLDRPDRPTLHIGEHHLLHGKMATLPKPYAVIRKAQDPASKATALQGDVADEESDEEREKEQQEEKEHGSAKKRRLDDGEDEEEGEGPLFPDAQDMFTTPTKSSRPLPPGTASSVAFSSPPRDYSSDLSSPPDHNMWDYNEEDDEEQEKERERERKRRERREKRRREQPRTRYYEVVAVVRKKVVFSLRPEPLVAATQLPE